MAGRRLTRMVSWLWIAVIALAAAGCAGASPPPAASSLPRTTLAACTVEGVPADCGYVWVPRDWAHPAGPTMPLRVVVLPAAGTAHPADPLFYLGGWGVPATGYGNVSWAAQAFWTLNQTMDLVFVAQRGTQDSSPENCPGLMTTGPALRAAVSRCLASVNRDPRHDTTAAAARDLDQARKALGYHMINLYGGSYGVSIGLAYLQAYGQHVRTAVFDSGSLLDVPLWQLQPLHTQQSFDQLAARCAATPACGRYYHPAADLATVISHLQAHPARVTVAGYGTATITVSAFLNFIEEYLSLSPQTTVLLPEDLHAMARGQWETVLRERMSTIGSAISLGTPLQTQLQEVTIRCGDAWAAMNPAQMPQQPTGSFPFGPMSLDAATWQRQLCALWPHDPGVSGVVRSSAPVLFLNGAADPADPPANVAAAPQTMPNALLVSVPYGTHGVLDNGGCVLSLTNAFVQAGVPVSRSAWAACTRGIQPPPFPTQPRPGG
jgi:pimeloyl-ACP methyl ester carboxylesterase